MKKVFILFCLALSTTATAQNDYENFLKEYEATAKQIEEDICDCASKMMQDGVRDPNTSELQTRCLETINVESKYEKFESFFRREGSFSEEEQEKMVELLGDLPHRISQKLLYDCPIYAAQMMRNEHYDTFHRSCMTNVNEMFNESLALTEVCNCHTDALIVFLVENPEMWKESNSNPQNDILEHTELLETLMNCFIDDINSIGTEKVFDVSPKGLAYVRNSLENTNKYKAYSDSHDIGTYCNCLFDKVLGGFTSNEVINHFTEAEINKKIQRIERKCDRKARLKRKKQNSRRTI